MGDFNLDNDELPITTLTEAESWELLSSQEVGRLATGVSSRPEIFPVNFAVADGCLYFRSAPGNKLLGLAINEQVAFEADDDSAQASGWSVVCHGRGEIVQTSEEIAAIDELGLHPWVQTIKTEYVRIRVDEITGRRFRFGDQPEIPGRG